MHYDTLIRWSKLPFCMQMNLKLAYAVCCLLLLSTTVHGSRSETARAPSWLEEPPSHVGIQHTQNVLLPCSASGEPRPEVFWLKNGERLNRNHSNANVPPILSNNSLFFNGSDPHLANYAGLYQCGARNIRGTILSRIARVTFWGWNTKNNPQACIKELTVADGWYEQDSVLVITCKVNFPWREHVKSFEFKCANPRRNNNNNNNANNPRISVMEQLGEMHIRNMNKDDCTTYRCIAHSGLVNDSCPVPFNVSYRVAGQAQAPSTKPFFDPAQREVSVDLGTTVELPCVASAARPTSRVWDFAPVGGARRPLPTDDKYGRVGNTSNLLISSVQLSDAGDYTCRASNSFGENQVQYRLTVRSPLRVTVRPSEQTVDLGGSRTLECDYSGSPLDELVWLKDGERVLVARRTSSGEMRIERASNASHIRVVGERATIIEIGNISSADRGIYQCLVTNTLDSAQASSLLLIGAPVFLDEPPLGTNYSKEPGSSVEMRCIVTAMPLPVVRWMLDDAPLVTVENRVVVESRSVFTDTVESILRLTNLTVLDSGEYRCVASNVSSNIRTLNVYGMVEAKPMENVVAVGGKSINLLCRVAGFPIGVVTWFRDKHQLPSDPLRQTVSDRTLRISGVVEADRGVYYCVPHTPDGQAGKNSSVVVAIKYPPSIKQENDRRVKEGDSVTLLCDINTSVNSIQWLKDGAQLQLKAGYAATQLQAGSNLAISQAKREFAGSYTCIARNDVGVANMTHSLIVEVPPGFAIEPPTEVTMDLGKESQIHCQGSGFPTPTLEWRRYPLAQGELSEHYVTIEKRDSVTRAQLPFPHPVVLPNGTLLISEAREDDNGTYLCVIKNLVGPDISRRTDVLIKIPAHFTEKRVNYSVVAGQSVSLVCRVKGSGVINVSWTHQNAMPRSGIVMSNITTDKGLIAWLNMTVDRNSGGTYECHANNSGAAVTQAHVVLVLDVPEPVRDLKTIGAPGSRSATIDWMAPRDNHSPILNYIVQFKLNTDLWASASVRTLVIPSVNTQARIDDLLPASTYNVLVFANNSIGQSRQGDTADFDTAEESPSGPPRNVTVSVDSPRSIRVRWLPPARAHRNGELRGYYVHWKECSDSQWQPHELITKTDGNDNDDTPNEYVIRSLSELRCYLITVQAFNAKGAGIKSEEIRQLTSEDLPKRPPQGIMVRAVTATSFSVSWQAPPLDDLGGVPLGYRVFVQQLQDDELETSVSAIPATTQTEVHVTGLRPYTNYTIRLLLYNRVGPSDVSSPVLVTTLQARPGRPAAIKLLANPSNITVLWLPPAEPNGIITSYVITLNSPSTSGPPWTLRMTRNAELRHDIPIVWQQGQQYHFTVKAINEALIDGDGDVIDARIGSSSISSPKIANLNRTIRVDTGGYVTLPCTVYGSSYVRWIVNLRSRNGNPGNSVVSEGKADKVLNAVRADDAGTYTCSASNNNDERDMVTYQLEVRDSYDSRVPQAPVLFAEWITESKAMLRWLAPSNGGSRIVGYELSVPNQPTQRLSPDARTHLVTRLNCTTQYNIQLRAQNANTIGKPGSLTIRTNGSRPIAALEDELRREVNATFVRLALRAFRANGCPITEFDISYASNGDQLRPLATLTGNTEFYTVPGLQPSASYEMLIVAKSDGGTAQTRLSFKTAAFLNHQKFEPSKFLNSAGGDRQTMSITMITILVTVIVVIILLVAVVAAIFFIKRRTLKKKQKEASTTNLRHNNDSEMVAFIGGTQRQSSAERGDHACPKGGNGQKASTVRQSSQESAVARCGGSAGRIRRNTSQPSNGAALTDDEDDIESQKKIAKKRMNKSISLEKLEKSQKDRPVQKVTKNGTQNKQYAEYAAKAKETRDKLLVNRNSTFDEYGTTKQQSKTAAAKQDEKRREQEHAAQLISYCMNDPATANGYAAYASRERGSNTLETESTIDPYAEFPAGHALSSYYQQGGSRTLLQTQHSLQLMQSQTQTCNTAPNGSHTVLLQRGDSFPYACYYPGLQHHAQLHTAPLANTLQSAGTTLTYGPAARCAHGYPQAQTTAMRCVRPSCNTCTSVSATVPFPCCCEMNNNTVGNSTQASVTTTVLPILPPLNENATSLNDSMMRVQPFYNTIMNGPPRFGSRLIRHHPMSNSMTTVSSTNDELAQAYERATRAPAQLSALLASEASSTVGPNNGGSDGQCAPTDCPTEATVTEAAFNDLGIRQFTQMPPCPDEQRQATCEIPYDAQKSRGSLNSTYGIAKRKGATNQQQPLLQQQQPRQIPLKFVATAPSKLQTGAQPQRTAARQKRNAEEQRKTANAQNPAPIAQPGGTGSMQPTANNAGVRNEEPIYEDPDEVAANMMRSSYHSQTSQPQGAEAKQAAPHTSQSADAQFSAFAKFDRTPKTVTRGDHVLTHVPPAGKNMATVPKVDFVPIRSNSDQPMSPSADADDDLPPPPPQPQSAPETAGMMSSTGGSSLYASNSKDSTSIPYSSAAGDQDYSAYQFGACPPNLTGALTITRNKDAKLTLSRADTAQQSEPPANNGFPTNARRKSSKQKLQAADQSRADPNSHAQVHRGAPASSNANAGTTSQTYYSTIPSLPYATAAEMASGRVEAAAAMQMSSSSATSDRTVRHVPLPQKRSTVDDDFKIYSDNIVV